MMKDNILIPLPGLALPRNFAWQVRFVDAVEEHLQKLHAVGAFVPPRFFGFYFAGEQPVAVSGGWTVALDAVPAIQGLADRVHAATGNLYSIASDGSEAEPDYLLVHDRRDGACWLWRYAWGLRFVAATEPVFGVPS